MLMADTMSIFFVILGMMLAFSGLWLLCRGLWPEAVAAAADRLQQASLVLLSRGIAYHDRDGRVNQNSLQRAWPCREDRGRRCCLSLHAASAHGRFWPCDLNWAPAFVAAR